ncbi:hypothetical protein [Desulfuribacillus alkaliarsenatis]|nr:hypothetical protein [Desulfuribacillus alkaliarsenatis]
MGFPFDVIWSQKGEGKYLVGVKVNDTRISYVAIGNGPQISSTSNEDYDLTHEETLQMNDIYETAVVKDNYVLYVLDNFNQVSGMITAFDKEGILIADKFPSENPRLLK